MKPKKFVNLRKPVAKAVVIKSNCEKLDKEVLKYMQRNHAASDLALNQKHIGKRPSLPTIVSAEENVTVTFTKLVSQQQINAIKRKNCYAVSDLALNAKKIDKRSSLPLILACTENQAPLYSCACIDDLSTCEPTTLFKITGKDSNTCEALQLSINEKIVKCSREHLDDKEIDISQEHAINHLNFLHANLHTTTNQKDVELQSLVPVVVEGKEEDPFNDNKDFNGNNELNGDNEKTVKKGRFRKAFKRVRNMFKKHF